MTNETGSAANGSGRAIAKIGCIGYLGGGFTAFTHGPRDWATAAGEALFASVVVVPVLVHRLFMREIEDRHVPFEIAWDYSEKAQLLDQFRPRLPERRRPLTRPSGAGTEAGVVCRLGVEGHVRAYSEGDPEWAEPAREALSASLLLEPYFVRPLFLAELAARGVPPDVALAFDREVWIDNQLWVRHPPGQAPKSRFKVIGIWEPPMERPN